MAGTMLDRYGRVSLTQIVSSFYSDVLRSSWLAPFFDGVPIEGLIAHQARFMAMVMGGPPAFTADEIETAHSRFGITDDDFDEMLRLLEKSLGSFEVDPRGHCKGDLAIPRDAALCSRPGSGCDRPRRLMSLRSATTRARKAPSR